MIQEPRRQLVEATEVSMQGRDALQELHLSPHYHSAVNAITRPDRMVFASRYLIERWLPDLGGDGLAILLWLRHKCFFNRKTGEKRDTVSVSIAEIAAGCHLSDRTVRRQLQTNTALRAFVSIQQEFTVEEKRHGIIQTQNAYRVLMDDPVHPADLPRVQEELQRRERAEHPEAEDPKERARRRAEVLRQQRQAAQSQAEVATPSQSGRASAHVTPCQNDRALPHTAPCHFGRALHEGESPQRPAKMTGDSIDYSSLLDQTTKQQQPVSVAEGEDVVVVTPASSENTSLVKSLCACGVTRSVAEDLIAQFPPDQIERQLAALPYRSATEPAAVLVTAIQGEWAMPSAYQKALDEQKRQEKLRQEAERKRQDAEKITTQDAAMRAAQDVFWQELGADEQERILAVAREMFRQKNSFLAGKLDKPDPGPIMRSMLDSFRRELIQAEMGEGQSRSSGTLNRDPERLHAEKLERVGS